MKQRQAPPPPTGFDPVLDSCLADLATGSTMECFVQAERYRQIDSALRRAVSIADPISDNPSVNEDFARRSVMTEMALILRVHERTMIALAFEATQLCGTFALTLAELAAGTITVRHAREILACAVLLPPAVHAGFELEALLKARTMDAGAFHRAAARIRDRLHPDPLAARTERARTDRRLVFEPAADGMAWLHLHLEAEKALAITDRVSRLATAAQNEAADALAHAGTADLAGGADPRGPEALSGVLGSGTHAQLEADIAAELLLGLPERPAAGPLGDPLADPLASASHLPGIAFIRPELFVATPQITISVDTLIGTSDDPAELHGYGPIDADTARRLATQAPTLHRVLTDPVDRTPLQLDPTQRHANAALRRWILYRDQTCRFPGCNRKAVYSEIDHTQPHEHGGLTAEDNLAALCKKHHRLKHNTRWRVTQLGHGVLRWLSPGGREYITGPSWVQHPPPRPSTPKPPPTSPDPPPIYPDDPPF